MRLSREMILKIVAGLITASPEKGGGHARMYTTPSTILIDYKDLEAIL